MVNPLHRKGKRASRLAAITAATLVAALLGAPAAHAQPPSSSGSGPYSTGDPGPTPPAPQQPTDLRPMEDGYGTTDSQDQAMRAASRQAKSAGKPVAVDALTTESQQVLALPTGRFELSANTEPVRAKRRGHWVPVDTTLQRNSDGTLSPKATAYGSVVLSGGGQGALARSTAGGTTVTVQWQTSLPSPTVSGSTATYRDVLPRVDLVVSATVSGGFSEVLVVRDATAARNPALSRIRLGTTVSHGRRSGTHTGTVSVASQRGGLALDSTTPLMWDSNTAAPASTRKAAPDPSDANHAGAAAKVATMRASSTAAALTLTPDAGMLSARSTVWPVYLDPTFNWHPTTGGTPAFDEIKRGSPCNGASYYDNTGNAGDYGQLGVGDNAWDSCIGTMRALYQWKIPSVIWGSHISSAEVDATEVYSAYCDHTSEVYLHWSGGIGAGTDWNNRPAYQTSIARVGVPFGPSYNPENCAGNGAVHGAFNVSTLVTKAASGHYAQITAALAEDDEEFTNPAGFKRFADNPTLQIFYNRKPNTPGPAQLAAKIGGTDLAACATATPYPYIGADIAGVNPTLLTAKITDPDGDALRATFKYWLDGNSTTHTTLSGDGLASGTTTTVQMDDTFRASLTNGQTVDWQVQVTDGEDTSAWSPVCHFTAEPTIPGIPTITSDGKYPDLDNGGGMGTSAGVPGYFTFTDTGSTATKFYFNLDVPPPQTNPPASMVATASGNEAYVQITPPSPGPHTLWVTAVDAAGDTSASMASYRFEANYDAIPNGQLVPIQRVCTSFANCRNNIAVSDNSSMSQGNADGNAKGSASFSAEDLAAAGWTADGRVTVDGANFTLPSWGTGVSDNVLAANQALTYPYTAPSTGSSALVFLASSTQANQALPGAIAGNATAPYVAQGTAVTGTYCFDDTDPAAYCPAKGTIVYTDGTQQAYYLTVPDWRAGPASMAAVTLPHVNTPTKQLSGAGYQPSIYPFSVPVLAGKSIDHIVLPDVSNRPDNSTPSLHIFGIAPRDTTAGTIEANGTTVAAPTGQTWTGAWGSPTEGNFNYQGSNFSNQTFRVDLRPSISGNTVRIKLDNALGTSPLNIGHATVALSPGPSWSVPNGPVVSLSFGGQQATTIPAGGMVYSDPLSFSVDASQYLLVSYVVTNSVPYLPEHSWTITADTHQFVTTIGSGDHTADTTDTAFTSTTAFNGDFSTVLTDVDVATNGVATQAVLGDGLIDAWEPSTRPDGSTGLADNLAATEPTTPAPYGTVSEGIESNFVMTDFPEAYKDRNVGGPAALSRIDRDILDQPGLTTVVLYEGLEDLLNGDSADDLEANGYTQLLSYLQANDINVIAVGLTPCDGYAGDGTTATGTSNDPCTATVDANRTTVNGWLADQADPWATPATYYIDSDAAVGVPDTANGETALHPDAAITDDHVNLTNPGYAALTTAYLNAQDTWLLDDGADDPTLTAASDTATNATNPYLLNNPLVGQNPATLTGDLTTNNPWTDDPTRGEVLKLDGSTAATTDNPVLTTSGSYTVSAWVNMANTTTFNTIASQESNSGVNAFYLQYSKTYNAWTFIANTTSAGGTYAAAHANTAPALNTWTHLAGVYNAAAGTLTLYVNGTQAGATSYTTPWNATGPFDIGHAGTSNYFPGMLSNIQAFNYALTATQVTALDQQIS